jgi:hypothetical protein
VRTAALLFFYGCLCAGAFWAFAAWARRSVARHVDAALDPRTARGLELAAGQDWAVVAEAERITREAAK